MVEFYHTEQFRYFNSVEMQDEKKQLCFIRKIHRYYHIQVRGL